MLSYELAKELMDAGFDGIILCDCHNPPKVLESPSLSELIAECGEEFLQLRKIRDIWEASGERSRNDTGLGSTPEIAMARHWLALNSKLTDA